MNIMVKTASYEALLDRMNNNNKSKTKALVWDLFWSVFALSDDSTV